MTTWSCCSPRSARSRTASPVCGARRCREVAWPGHQRDAYRCNQLGAFGLDEEIRGWSLKDTWQAQFTATRTFANIFKASQMVLVFEGAVSYIPDLENKFCGGPTGRGLRYNGRGTSVSGNVELANKPLRRDGAGRSLPGQHVVGLPAWPAAWNIRT